MLSELLVVSALLGAPPDAAGSTADVGAQAKPAPSGPVCSADERRARRETAARERRLHREALQVTRETLAHAEDILANRGAQAIQDWQADFRARARTRLEGTRDRDRSVQRLPTPALCRALAQRDTGACGELSDPDEAGPCQVWAAVVDKAGKTPSQCSSLAPTARAICALAEQRDASVCEGASGSSRAICESAARALSGGDGGCETAFHAQRCTWSLLMRALAKGASACDTKDDRPSARRAEAYCRAALGGDAATCPTDDRPSWANAAGTRDLHVEQALRLENNPEGQVAWVALMSSAPAVCAIEVKSEDSAHRTFGAVILASLADERVRMTPLAGPSGPRSLSVTCTPTVDWRATP